MATCMTVSHSRHCLNTVVGRRSTAAPLHSISSTHCEIQFSSHGEDAFHHLDPYRKSLPEGAGARHRCGSGLQLRHRLQVGALLAASGRCSSGTSNHTNYSELEPTPSELSHNHRENEEDTEADVVFEAMHLDVNTKEEEAEGQIPAPAYDAAVLSA
ncbi:hypothetical protein TRIUR3_04562 [Triticum urartu]|uniref:Uncharacterized protein n=1 Tax=Triticum urartu TaxID=4572 RepID=M8A665_TRIUA|nr:hypothetical protein TRIUR3_04562 [Triticum urartu]